MRALLAIFVLWTAAVLAGPSVGGGAQRAGPKVGGSSSSSSTDAGSADAGTDGGSIPADVVAYWSFNAGSSHDDTGNGHNGTDTNVTYGAPVYLGASAAQFGIVGSPRIALTSIPLGSGAWSMRAAVFPIANGNVNIIGDGASSFPANGHGLQVYDITGGLAQFAFAQSNGFAKTFSRAGGLNEWYELVVTQSATGTLNAYIDGVLAGTWAGVSNTIAPDRIGSDINMGGPYRGTIDEVALWNIELSQAQVTAAFGKTLTDPGFP